MSSWGSRGGPLREAERAVARSLIVATLRRFGGNRTRTAKALGIDPRRLRARIRQLAIDVPAPPLGCKWHDGDHPRPAA